MAGPFETFFTETIPDAADYVYDAITEYPYEEAWDVMTSSPDFFGNLYQVPGVQETIEASEDYIFDPIGDFGMDVLGEAGEKLEPFVNLLGQLGMSFGDLGGQMFVPGYEHGDLEETLYPQEIEDKYDFDKITSKYENLANNVWADYDAGLIGDQEVYNKMMAYEEEYKSEAIKLGQYYEDELALDVAGIVNPGADVAHSASMLSSGQFGKALEYAFAAVPFVFKANKSMKKKAIKVFDRLDSGDFKIGTRKYDNLGQKDVHDIKTKVDTKLDEKIDAKEVKTQKEVASLADDLITDEIKLLESEAAKINEMDVVDDIVTQQPGFNPLGWFGVDERNLWNRFGQTGVGTGLKLGGKAVTWPYQYGKYAWKNPMNAWLLGAAYRQTGASTITGTDEEHYGIGDVFRSDNPFRNLLTYGYQPLVEGTKQYGEWAIPKLPGVDEFFKAFGLSWTEEVGGGDEKKGKTNQGKSPQFFTESGALNREAFHKTYGVWAGKTNEYLLNKHFNTGKDSAKDLVPIMNKWEKEKRYWFYEEFGALMESSELEKLQRQFKDYE